MCKPKRISRSYAALAILTIQQVSAFPFPAQPLRNITYPADAGVINVKNHGVVGNGVTDDTAALQALITANLSRGNVLYFPNGTYKISDSLNYGSSPAGVTLEGQSRNGVIIRLQDNATGFATATDSGAKPILEMVRKTNDAVFANGFNLFVRNLTIHTGSGNPGAIGIRFMGNNFAGISDVTIRSGHASKDGWAGLCFDRRASGPAFFTRIEIDGFRQGIRTSSRNYCEVFEDILVKNQTQFGIYVGPSSETMSFRRLTSQNSVPAIHVAEGNGANQFRFAQVTIVDGHFTGGAADKSAIENGSFVVLKNVLATGYQRIANNTHSETPSLNALRTERMYISDVAHSLFPSQIGSLNLTVLETPAPPNTAPENWVRVNPGTISTATVNGIIEKRAQLAANLQAAIDSAASQGKDTVYLPKLGSSGERTRWYLGNAITIKGSVRRIIGLGSTVEITSPMRDGTGSVFTFDSTLPNGANVSIEGFAFGPSAEGRYYNFTLFHHGTSKANIILRNIGAPSSYSYKASAGAGNVFIENCSLYENLFVAGQKIWARQYNTESQYTQTTLNGSEMWCLGLKTENHGEAIKATNAKLEVCGGFLTPSHPNLPTNRVAFDLIDTQANITTQFDGVVSATGWGYHTLVREKRGSITRLANVRNFPLWGSSGGGTIQLFSSIPEETGNDAFNQGYALRQLWDTNNLPTNFNDPSTWDAKTPNLRSQTASAITFWTHQNWTLKYGLGFYERVRVRPVASSSGNYRFFVHRGSTNDQVALRWSADGSTTTTTLTLSSDPNHSMRLRTAELALTHGQAPLIELFINRAQSTANASIGWYRPDGTSSQRLGNELILGFNANRGIPARIQNGGASVYLWADKSSAGNTSQYDAGDRTVIRSWAGWESQQWMVEPMTDNWSRIRQLESGLCLWADKSSAGNSGVLDEYDLAKLNVWNGWQSQQWKFEESGTTGWPRLRLRAANFYLWVDKATSGNTSNIDDGDWARIRNWNNWSSMRWQIQAVP